MQIRRLVLALAVVVTGATGLTSVASGASVRNSATRAVPLAKLVGIGSSAAFNPKRLDLQVFTAVSCGDKPVPHQFNLLNGTSVNQVVVEGATKIVKLAPGQEVAECSFTNPGTYTLGVKSNPHAKLTLVVGG